MYSHLHFIKRQRIETCLIIVGLSDSCLFEMETTEHPMIYLDYTTNPTQWRHHGRHACKDQQNTNKTQIKSAQDSSTFKTFHQALGEEKPQGPPRTSLSNFGSFLSVCVSMLITQWTACGSQFGAWSQSLSVVPCLSTGPLEVLLDEETDTCENQVITCWEWAALWRPASYRMCLFRGYISLYTGTWIHPSEKWKCCSWLKEGQATWISWGRRLSFDSGLSEFDAEVMPDR